MLGFENGIETRKQRGAPLEMKLCDRRFVNAMRSCGRPLVSELVTMLYFSGR